MDRKGTQKEWAISTISWYAVFVWFGASLFSQVAYMAINGVPYDVDLLLAAAGTFAWIIIGLEIIVWLVIAILVSGKVANRLMTNGRESGLADTITPQA